MKGRAGWGSRSRTRTVAFFAAQRWKGGTQLYSQGTLLLGAYAASSAAAGASASSLGALREPPLTRFSPPLTTWGMSYGWGCESATLGADAAAS